MASAVDAFITAASAGDGGGEAGGSDALNDVLVAVHGGELTVVRLVQQLGVHLTNADDDGRRQRATLLLAEVLARLPDLALAPEAVMLFVDFFAARMADAPCGAAVARGVE